MDDRQVVDNNIEMIKAEKYRQMVSQGRELVSDVPYLIANLANLSALIWQTLDDINWAGFYLADDRDLILGPFQGKPACIRIPFGKGVCGTAAMEDRTVLVEDVHQFPGHIACDCASRSEIVVPMHRDGELIGVLDIDSPVTGRFTETDRKWLETFIKAVGF